MENFDKYKKLSIENLRTQLRKEHQLFLTYLKKGRDQKMQETNEKINFLLKLIDEKSCNP
jgi:hypothetical protein